MTTQSDLAINQEEQAALEARSSSGSTVKIGSTALAFFLMVHQPWVLAPPTDRQVTVIETNGTATEAFSLQITQEDLVFQLARVHRVLTNEQVELDEESSRILYKNLWALY